MQETNYIQRFFDLSLLIILAFLHYKVCSYYLDNVSITVVALPVVITFVIYLAISNIFEFEDFVDGLSNKYSFIDTVFSVGSALGVYLIIWLLIYLLASSA